MQERNMPFPIVALPFSYDFVLKDAIMMFGEIYLFGSRRSYRAFSTYSYVGIAITLWVTRNNIPTEIGQIGMKFLCEYFIGDDHSLPQI